MSLGKTSRVQKKENDLERESKREKKREGEHEKGRSRPVGMSGKHQYGVHFTG